MAEDVLRYKIELDDSDLSSKLVELQDKVQQTLSSSLGQMYSNVEGAGTSFGATAVNAISNAAGIPQGLSNFASPGLEKLSLGYQKFAQDFHLNAVTENLSYQDTYSNLNSAMYSQNEAYSNIAEKGFFGRAFGSLG